MRFRHLTLLLLLPIFIYGQRQQVRLLFVGDLMQHQAQIDAALQANDTYDYTHCFSLVKERIRSADLAIGNLEVTLGGKPYHGYPRFSAPDEYLRAIKEVGQFIEAHTRSNNLLVFFHIYLRIFAQRRLYSQYNCRQIHRTHKA